MPSSPGGIGLPSAASALGITSTVRRGVPWIDYGISTINNTLTNGGLLLAFKENFNMQGFFRDTFTLDL